MILDVSDIAGEIESGTKSLLDGTVPKDYPMFVVSAASDTSDPKDSVFCKSLEKSLLGYGIPTKYVTLDEYNRHLYRVEVNHRSSGYVIPNSRRSNLLIGWEKEVRPGFDLDRRREGVPAVAMAVIETFEKSVGLSSLNGRDVLVIGRSERVGLPIADWLIEYTNAVITVTNSHDDIKRRVKGYDYIVSTLPFDTELCGKWLSDNTTVIDVAGSFIPDDRDDICYTPRVGGIGKLTTEILVNLAARVIRERTKIEKEAREI